MYHWYNLESKILKFLITFVTLLLNLCVLSQNNSEAESIWDNQLWLSGKLNLGTGRWRYSGEFQSRTFKNYSALDQWFLEAIASRLLSKKIEIAVPIRFADRGENNEFRPGLSLLYKLYPHEKISFVNQFMYQTDIDPNQVRHGIRYVLFFNWKASEHWIPNAVAGIFYRWQPDFEGFQFIRTGLGLSYHINTKHFINFNYFLGMSNKTERWVYQGIAYLQFSINLNRDYDHKPAKYQNR